MLPPRPERSTATPMLDRLRSSTRTAHAALEQSLGLLDPPLSRARFTEALAGFHAFHLAWEPRVAGLVQDPAFFDPRRRLARLERDLETLGASPAVRDPLALGFLVDRATAWGSLYVMEGSTLGGQLISKALRDGAAWVPAEGLGYFNPYGRGTAAMWRRFCEALETEAVRLDPERIVDGARQTFHALQDSLVPRLRAAA